MTSPEIDVAVDAANDGWFATVVVRDASGETQHRVSISREALASLAPDAAPGDLVRTSFEFLLEREPKEAILGEFDIDVICRCFPDYPRAVRQRLGQ